MAEDIAGLAGLAGLAGTANRDCERVVGVVVGAGHGQADDQRGAVVEGARGEYQEGMSVAHLAAGLRVAVDPDDVLAVRHPGGAGCPPRFGGCYHCSAPSAALAIASPPCRAGSKRARRCSSVRGASASGVMMTRPCSTDMRTRWSARR